MYVTNEQSKTPIFQINQHIGLDKDILDEVGNVVQQGDGQGIDGIIFAEEVLRFNETDYIDELLFFVNSQGGDVQKSLDMFNAISMSKKKTHAIITGFAFSCAGWIPMAADKVDMVEETGRWMCHMPYDPQDPEQKSQFMDEVVDIISKTIASKSGRNGKPKKTQDEVKKLMLEKTYWDAERMHREGLIDRIVNSNGKVVRLDKDPITLNKSELNFYYKEFQVAQNKLVSDSESENKEKELKTKNSQSKNIVMPFEQAINRLNKIDKTKTGVGFSLSSDASEDEIVSAIAKLENRLRANNDEMMDKETELQDKEKIILDNKCALDAAKKMAEDKEKEAKDAGDSYNKMKEAHDKLEVENKSMKEKEDANNAEVKAADLKFRQERAKNLVEKLIEQKKVFATDEMTIDKAKDYLINKATESYEDVVTQFSFSPVKHSAAKPGLKNQLSSGTNVNLGLIDKLVADNRERISKGQFVIDGGVKRSLYDNSIMA